ncbi:hypothetical protein ACJIZ3_011481 [Penstemon smallii]|uniref:Transmembrane protein n=1 Tax=Penstemon smallii TaxID=265156 RepID=A0ABD3UJ82_9LAMI
MEREERKIQEDVDDIDEAYWLVKFSVLCCPVLFLCFFKFFILCMVD